MSPTSEFALMLAVLHHSLKTAGSLDDFRADGGMIGAPLDDRAASATFAQWLRPED